ncbi:MAG: ABC transporter substrate-binding protein [Sphingomonadales bacterium]|nr:ABC transporter substrate-binding protein [Sphingomonadales bacterium]
MRLARPLARTLIATLLAGAVASCHRGDDGGVRVAVIGDPASPFETGARLSPAAQLVRGATVEGLVAFDEEGRVVPALADRWIVADDGLSYIFRLRDGAFGTGSAPATQARAALLQAIAGLDGTPLALDLAAIDEVRAMAGRVVEIRLSRPEPDLLLLLAQPELGLRRPRAESPMTLRRSGSLAILAALPPEKRGLPALEDWAQRNRPVRLSAMNAADALSAFAARRVDYVLGGDFADLPRIGLLSLGRSRPRFDTVAGLFGLQVTAAQGVLSTPATREAVAKAIDRDAIGPALGIAGWIATTRIVAPGLDGDSGQVDERWQGMTIAARQAQAAATIAAWAKGRHEPARVRIALPQGLGADALFARLQADLAAIGIAADRVGPSAPADLRLLDLVARRARAGWFLNQLSCTAGRGACSELADAAAQRAATAEPSVAADTWAQAEATLTQANTFIPLGQPIRWSLAASEGPGFSANRWAVHPLLRLATTPN